MSHHNKCYTKNVIQPLYVLLNFLHSPDSHKKLCSLYFQIANKLKPLLTIANSLSHHCRFSLSSSPNPASPSPNPAFLSQTPSQTQPHRHNHYRKPNLTVANPTSLSPILVSPSPFLALLSPILASSSSILASLSQTQPHRCQT